MAEQTTEGDRDSGGATNDQEPARGNWLSRNAFPLIAVVVSLFSLGVALYSAVGERIFYTTFEGEYLDGTLVVRQIDGDRFLLDSFEVQIDGLDNATGDRRVIGPLIFSGSKYLDSEEGPAVYTIPNVRTRICERLPQTDCSETFQLGLTIKYWILFSNPYITHASIK